MKTAIFFFSGKGSSLKTAILLSEKLENTTIIPIRQDTDVNAIKDYSRVGIISPVIDLGIPDFVLRFIDKLETLNSKTYLFAIATNGGMPCASLSQIEKRLKEKHLNLSASFLLRCGKTISNSDDWKKQVEQIAQIILKQQNQKSKETIQDKLLTAMGHSVTKLLIPSQDKKFQVNDRCIGCGVCQRICPVGNIKIVNKRPVWQHSCEQCAACFNWCPNEAITGTNLAAKTRFRIPDIKLEQMIRVQLTDNEIIRRNVPCEENNKN